ncbi:nuclear transport factor 2 family protein [Georgenia sp. H159]|uniref:nuclear transport factor 2 family protein n=1 Tax=Georgenia sp. H159 TaxID=3076115 RepID=UPI002D79F097|nr:nuclear transport factor 2 family protein [Georgenia sp. H159]
MTEPRELERQGWQALSTDAASATAFYDEVLDADVRMLFPGGLMLTERAQILATMGGPAWDSFELSGLEELRPTDDVAVVTYEVEAARGGQPYSALVASLYVRRSAGWRMVSHQHTPR